MTLLHAECQKFWSQCGCGFVGLVIVTLAIADTYCAPYKCSVRKHSGSAVHLSPVHTNDNSTNYDSTQATLSKVDKVDRVVLSPYTLVTKSKGRSTFGDKYYPLSTKSTELNTFNFGSNVDRDTVDKVERAGDSRQTGDNLVADLSPVLATVDFVPMQCVPGLGCGVCVFFNILSLYNVSVHTMYVYST